MSFFSKITNKLKSGVKHLGSSIKKAAPIAATVAGAYYGGPAVAGVAQSLFGGGGGEAPSVAPLPPPPPPQPFGYTQSGYGAGQVPPQYYRGTAARAATTATVGAGATSCAAMGDSFMSLPEFLVTGGVCYLLVEIGVRVYRRVSTQSSI